MRSVSRRSAAASVRAGALALVGVIFLSGTVSADSTSGRIGHFLFPDYYGATCRYVNDWGQHWALWTIAVLPPSVWWPNTDRGDRSQKGTVGWRAIVQEAMGVDGPWSTIGKTPIQKATAHEDQGEPYGEASKAVFTRLIIPRHADGDPNNWSAVRIIVKAFWYRRDGSVRGWAEHRILGYRTRYGTVFGTAEQFCPNDIFAG